MGVWADFKKFASNPSFANMAVGIVVGIAVTTVVGGVTGSVISPAVGLVFHGNLNNVGNVTVGGSTFTFGVLFQDLINFLIVLGVVFVIIVYPMLRVERRRTARTPAAKPTTRECPECYSTINRRAKRCAFCGSEVTPLDP
ncbi:MAG TPA: MscL family protein [Thermoplasmata archaeon]|nr:MscL family protein [Thermoplasmata archaeon]